MRGTITPVTFETGDDGAGASYGCRPAPWGAGRTVRSPARETTQPSCSARARLAAAETRPSGLASSRPTAYARVRTIAKTRFGQHRKALLRRWRHEHVANAAYSANGVWMGRIGLDLAAQSGDAQVDGAVESLHLSVCSHLE